MGDRGWPVSVKGVVRVGSRVLLCLNDRDEWELPGGRLEDGEELASCVEREVREETGLEVRARSVVHAASFEVVPGRQVVVLAYECQLVGDRSQPEISPEHQAVAFVEMDDLDTIDLPSVYRRAIEAAARR